MFVQTQTAFVNGICFLNKHELITSPEVPSPVYLCMLPIAITFLELTDRGKQCQGHLLKNTIILRCFALEQMSAD
jgi:hypothetical protein